MRWTACLAALFGPGLAAILSAAEPPAPAAGALEPLIEQLGDKDFKRREAASKALEARGVEALPTLRKAQGHADAEVRRRLDELIPVLETRIALQPRRVTLQASNKPLKQIVAELARQTGYRVQLAPETPEREKQVYSFQIENQTFWDALQQLGETTGLTVQQNYYGDDVLRLQPVETDQYVPFAYHNGPFRVVAQGFSYSRSIQFGTLSRNLQRPPPASTEYLSLGINLSVEPRLPLLHLGQVRITTAEDEQQHSMVPPANPNAAASGPRYYYGGGYRCYSQHVQAALVWPSKSARTLKVLKGVIPVTLLADQKPLLQVENVLAAKGKKVQAETTQLEVEDVRDAPKEAVGNGKGYQLKLSLRDTKAEGAGDYTWTHTLAQRLELFDAKGNKFASRGYSWNETTPASVKGATFTFGAESTNGEALGPPAKLVLYSWIRREHEVPFEFRDLPLP